MAEVGREYTLLGLIQCIQGGTNVPSFIEYRGRTYRYEKDFKDYTDIDDYTYWLTEAITELLDQESFSALYDETVKVVESPVKLDELGQHILRNLFEAINSMSDRAIEYKDIQVYKSSVYLYLKSHNESLILVPLDPYHYGFAFKDLEYETYYNLTDLIDN